MAREIDSVKKRYIVTLLSNAAFFVVSLVTAGIVPRALGPKELGDFGFLSRVSAAFRNFLNLETSSAFFTVVSKEDRSGAVVKTYSIWLIGQLVAVLGIIALAFYAGLYAFFWPGQQIVYIVWVAVLDWVIFLGTTLKSLGDAKGLTVKAQIINLIISISNIAILIFFAFMGWLNLGRYIAILFLTSAALVFFLIWYVIIPNREIYLEGAIKERLKVLQKYFLNYCSPLVAYAAAAFIFEYFDRLILQRFSLH